MSRKPFAESFFRRAVGIKAIGETIFKVARALIASPISPYSTSSRGYDPSDYLVTNSCFEPVEDITYHLHAHHGTSISRMVRLASDLDGVDFIITSSRDEVLTLFRNHGFKKTYAVENYGRNFGALFQILNEVSTTLVIHLHEKKSTHMPDWFGTAWLRHLWRGLAIDGNDNSMPKAALRWLSASFENVLAYPSPPKLFLSRTLSWGSGQSLLRYKHFSSENRTFDSNQRFGFPTGAMFMARTSYIRDLLKDWTAEKFTREPFSLDGDAEHFLERLLSVRALESGKRQAVIDIHRGGLFSNHFHAIYTLNNKFNIGFRRILHKGEFDFAVVASRCEDPRGDSS